MKSLRNLSVVCFFLFAVTQVVILNSTDTALAESACAQLGISCRPTGGGGSSPREPRAPREPREPREPSNTEKANQHLHNGYEYEKAGNWRAAEYEYRQAINLEPNWYGYRSALARVFENQGYYDEAIQLYKQSITLNPKNAESYGHIGVILFNNLQRYEEAEQYFLDAHRIDPEDPQEKNNLIFTVNRLSNDTWNNVHYKSVNLFKSGKFAEAEALFRKILLADPSNARDWSNLGAALENQGRYLAAEAAYREAIRRDPTFQLAADNMKQLRESDGHKNALKGLIAASEQGAMAKKELDMEAMKGRAMSCFDFNEDATKTIRCSYSTDRLGEMSVFLPTPTPQPVEPVLPAEVKAKLEKDPSYVGLREKKRTLEKKYKEKLDALQVAVQTNPQAAGNKSESATDLMISEYKDKLAKEKEEQEAIDRKMKEIERHYVLD